MHGDLTKEISELFPIPTVKPEFAVVDRRAAKLQILEPVCIYYDIDVPKIKSSRDAQLYAKELNAEIDRVKESLTKERNQEADNLEALRDGFGKGKIEFSGRVYVVINGKTPDKGNGQSQGIAIMIGSFGDN